MFFITSGVRRALASLEAGRKTVPAIIYREGKRPESRKRMPLDELFTSKTVVERDARYLRIVPPIDTAIEVEDLGERGQPGAIPLSHVRLK
jgi:hypothetical protein